jgi:ABC-type uncharacterized transport system substrate-binding protein
MTIKLKCNDCGNQYDIDGNDFLIHAKLFKYCEFCGGEMKAVNIEEIVEHDTQIKVRDYVTKWIKEIGADETIDLIKRNTNQKIRSLYISELRRRGFNIKEE